MNQKKKLWSLYLSIPFGIAIIACFIVNQALDRQLTWSVIVAGGCIFAYLLLFVLILGGKHRMLLAYIVICIFVIPYLYIIEKTTNLSGSEPTYWVTSFGVPVSIVWLAACGTLILLRKITRANGWLIGGIGVLAFYVAERYTNLKIDELAGSSAESWRLSEQYPVVYFGLAAVLIFIGVIITANRLLKQ